MRGAELKGRAGVQAKHRESDIGSREKTWYQKSRTGRLEKMKQAGNDGGV